MEDQGLGAAANEEKGFGKGAKNRARQEQQRREKQRQGDRLIKKTEEGNEGEWLGLK